MNTILKRVISLVLCFVLVAGYLPTGALATETGETTITEATEATTAPTAAASEETEEASEPEESSEDEEETEASDANKLRTINGNLSVASEEGTTAPSAEASEPTVVAVTGITLDQTALEVEVGAAPITLTATVAPEDATDKTVTWSSSESGVASVENGVLTFGYMGKAVITATAGEFSAECTVTVGEGEAVVYVDSRANSTMKTAAIFFSDVHEESTGTSGSGTTAMKNVLATIGQNGVSYETIGLVGDTYSDKAGTMANMTSAAQGALGQTIPCYYAYGDHDEESDIDPDSGLMYTGDYYYIYHISDANMRSGTASQSEISYTDAITNFKNAAVSWDKSKVLFIMSHVPLHDRRDDNTYANAWYTAITEVAETMDVVFFWAHNHTSESDVDRAAYYVAKDGSETMTIYGGSTITPNFTYMNAGYIYAAGQNPSRKGVATTVEIYSDKMVFQDYNSSGEYTDSSYSHNVTVARTSSTDSGDSDTVTLSSIAVTTQPTKTAYTVGETFDSTGLVVTATYSDGNTATVTDYDLSTPDMTTAGTKTITVTYGENNTVVTTTFDITVSASDSGESGGTTTTTKDVYVLVDALTVGEDYLIANGNSGTVTLLGQSSGSATTTTATVVTEGDYTYIETADSGYIWNATAHPNSSYSSYPRLINAETYAMYYSSGLAFGSGLTNTNGAIYTRYWTYTDGVLACVSTNSGSTTYYMTSDFGMQSTSTTGVYIYEKQTISVETEVTLSSISVSGATTTFNVGDTFSYDGLTVTAAYSDGSTATVTPTSVSSPDMTTAGEKPVTVTYTEDGVTKTATYTITVNEVISETATVTGIAVEGATTDFTLGETFNSNGLVVTATYDDNGTTKTKVLSADEYTVTAPDMTTEGIKTVTVSYTYGETTVTETYEITVTEAASNDVTVGGTTTTTKTVYVLTSSITSGTSYLIANSNSAGSAYVVANNSGEVDATGVTVKTDSSIGTYIELDDATDELWTVGSGYTFKNGSYYLYPRTQNNGSLELNSRSRDWSYSNNRLSYTSSNSGSSHGPSDGTNSTYYLYYNNGWDVSTSTNSVYFYVPTEIEVEVDGTVNYTMRAEDMTKVVTDDNKTETIDFCLQGNSADLTTLPSGGSYSFTVVSDEKGIIDSIASDGTITFTGAEGTAKVKVAYTWTDSDNNTYTVYKNITVTATEPYYTVELHEATLVYTEAEITAFEDGVTYFTLVDDEYVKVEDDAEFDSSVTYYTVSATKGDEITKAVYQKGVEAGDTYSVWAVVTAYDGELDGDGVDAEELGTLGDALSWSVSDTSIATIDEDTGLITFTGKEGSVTVRVTYTVDGKEYTDKITIIATKSIASTDENDYPVWGQPGSVRYDKTATAVGDFSKTGVAQIELSMAGIPSGGAIDVVLMLDMTGSMTEARIEALNAATKVFIRNIVLSGSSFTKSNIAVYYFNKDGATPIKTLGTISTTAELEALEADIDTLIKDGSDAHVSGGTPYSTALEACQTALAASSASNPDYVVFMSDGEPKKDNAYIDVNDNVYSGDDAASSIVSAGYPAEKYSTAMKADGVTIFTVGLGITTESYQTIINNIASDSSKAYQVADADAAAQMTNVFAGIANEINAASNVVVEDMISDDYNITFAWPTAVEEEDQVDGQEFYIEVVEYELGTDNERTGLYKVLQRVYFTTDDKGALTGISKIATSSTYGGDLTVTTDFTPSYTAKTKTTDKAYYDEDGNYVADGSGGYHMSTGAKLVEGVIYTPYFVYDTATKVFTWTVTTLTKSNEIALRYFVYLTDSLETMYDNVYGNEVPAGPYETNAYATMSYTNHLGNPCERVFPVPQLTWNGAQVAYVFYLVDANGNPVNRSGESVSSFNEAVFVTDIFTESVVWNDTAGIAKLDISYYADDLLPEGYKLYDANASYTVYVHRDAGTENSEEFNYFIIEGNDQDTLNNAHDVSAANVATTKVYNTKAGTKYTIQKYGTGDDAAYTYNGDVLYSAYSTEGTSLTHEGTTYSSVTELSASEFDYGATTVAFAVTWEVKVNPDTVVVDYGLPVDINVVSNDFIYNLITGITETKPNYGTGGDKSLPSYTPVATTEIEGDNYTAQLLGDNVIRYTPTSMEFDVPNEFYYETQVEYYVGGEKMTPYMNAKVTVIPATTVYYEDEFVTLTTETKGDSGWTTDENSGWVAVYDDGETSGDTATQAQDRPGASKISAALDADNNYGYDAAYSSMSQYSLGSAAKVNVYSGHRARATFEFYGTGFDVISLTSNTTGTITVKAYAWDDDTGAYSTDPTQSYVVDTYYGMEEDGTLSTNNPDTLYQVPVMKISGLTYGKYKAEIVAAYGSLFDHNESGNYDFYLDAIRIYDPTGNLDETANKAYVADGEAYPIYQELRNNIIAASNYKVTENEDGTVTVTGDDLSGAIFIDCADATTSIADYVSYGPNNELYLANNQAIAFNVTNATTDTTIADIQLGIKVGNGGTVTYEINGDSYTVNTTTDMYYSILDYAKAGTVTIKNVSSGILSLTNIKVTYTEAPATTSEVSLLSMDGESVGIALLSLRPVAEDEETEETTTETTTPEETESEETTTETTAPEETESEDSTTETTVPEETESEETESSTEEQIQENIQNVVNTVVNALKNFFGKWFS